MKTKVIIHVMKLAEEANVNESETIVKCCPVKPRLQIHQATGQGVVKFLDGVPVMRMMILILIP